MDQNQEAFSDSTTKRIELAELLEKNSKNCKTGKNEKTEKTEKKQKVLAKTDEWNEYLLSDLSHDAQKCVVEEAIGVVDDGPAANKPVQILTRLIKIKQQGYKAQDVEKRKYDKNKFVDLATILSKLRGAGLQCFYCKEPVKVFYEYCRDPKQWTLERIDNAEGHNKENVEIACLQCNVARRTMYYERYQITKQCVIRKLDHH